MRALRFYSCLAAQIQKFINLRRLSGTDYQSQALLLGYFDRFLLKQGLGEPRMSREIVELYQESLLRLAPKTRSNRFCVVRQLCAYLSNTDPLCYIPEPMRSFFFQPAHSAYIYSHSEVQTLLRAAAQLPPPGSLWPHACQTLLGLLYSTGIRIGEALALNLADFHSAEESLYVAEGKFRKARWIPLSSSGNKALQQYLRRRVRMTPRSPDSPLFLNSLGRRLRHCMMHQTLRRLLRQCGIPSDGNSKPRIHDLRHTFAVGRLLAWYRDGQDVNLRLPWLATYMGHVNIRSTQIYLHATAELIDQVNQRFRKHYLNHVKTKEEK